MTDVLWFFGGYKATFSDMDLWKASADHQNVVPYVSAFPYPTDADANADSAVSHCRQLDNLVERLVQQDSYNMVLAGHSSGCAISNEIALRAFRKGAKNFKLICLDGFVPHSLLLENNKVQVWSAKCGDVVSMNYKALIKAAGPYFHTYFAKDCKSKWALHFSLVNKSASDSLIKTISDGYKHCVANLEWLK